MKLYTATSLRRRLFCLAVVALAVVVIFTGRLWWLQIFRGRTLQLRAAEQWYRDLPLMAERGTITDTNGVVLAQSTLTYSVYLRPVAVTDAVGTAQTLAALLGLSYDNLYQKATSRTVSEWLLKMQVDKATAMQIVAAQLPGVYLSQTYRRTYPLGTVGAQVLGLVSVDNHGQAGVEAYYDTVLRGTDGYQATPSDLRGVPVDNRQTYYVAGTPGQSLQLHLDGAIQNAVQNILQTARETHGANHTAALVVDIATGGIVAAAAAPFYDLNAQPRDDVTRLLTEIKNLPLINVLEPGSTFKTVTLAAALAEGVVSLNDTFHCAGSRVIAGEKIKCWKTKGHGTQSLAEGVNNSCNCVFMDLALRLGVDKYYQYLQKFGIGTKTGVDYFGEPSGLLLNPSRVRDVDLARIGFGQAIALSPVQFLTTVAGLVGDGVLKTPRLVQSIAGTPVTAPTRGQMLAPQISQTLRELLYGVVRDGSGKAAAVPGYQVGGKTGTAQKYQNGVIAAGKYVSSFWGFLAVQGQPRYACYLYVDEPVGAYYGSVVAAPYVGQIFRQIAMLKNLPAGNN